MYYTRARARVDESLVALSISVLLGNMLSELCSRKGKDIYIRWAPNERDEMRARGKSTIIINCLAPLVRVFVFFFCSSGLSAIRYILHFILMLSCVPTLSTRVINVTFICRGEK